MPRKDEREVLLQVVQGERGQAQGNRILFTAG
jgi:hypothetical protein